MLTPDDIAAVFNKIQECLDKAEAHYGKKIQMPKVCTDLKGVCAGRAYYNRHLIRLNAVLFAENKEAFMKRTVVHEVAHLIAFAVYGRRIRPHGKEWASVMRLLGSEPSRCHTYDVTRSIRGKAFPYKCGCRKHALSSIRHKRVQTQGAKYTCNSCRQQLVPDHQTVTT